VTTTVYGASDDLIEVEGDVHGEVGTNIDEGPVLLCFSDGTLIAVTYGKPTGEAVWHLVLLRAGPLFLHIDVDSSEGDGSIYSDVAYFLTGLKGVRAGHFVRGQPPAKWEKVK
jgi:hypothetical protein